MELQTRGRYFKLGTMQAGAGCLLIEPQDFPRLERDALVDEITTAYLAGTLQGEMLETARRIANALRSPRSMLEGLRVQLQADGREMVAKIVMVSTVVPALLILTEWIGLAA